MLSIAAVRLGAVVPAVPGDDRVGERDPGVAAEEPVALLPAMVQLRNVPVTMFGEPDAAALVAVLLAIVTLVRFAIAAWPTQKPPP